MMMVVFGAGASYDSAPARPSGKYPGRMLPARPPLATELFLDSGLFAAALRNFPQCNAIVPYLRSIPAGVTLEHVLESLQAEGESDPERKRQMAAIRFYLHFMIWECGDAWVGETAGITNYVTLIDQLRRCRESSEPVVLVTFNYDRLIEEALNSIGTTITDIPDYIKHDRFKLFKLHGSVHWGREVETPIADVVNRNAWEIGRELIDRASELKISDRYRMSPHRPIGKIDNVPLFPAIAIPVETKRNFECPGDHWIHFALSLERLQRYWLWAGGRQRGISSSF
jgi:hypothetical protein